jgi:hypothetical protein
MTKLTLLLDKETIKKAKRIAEKNGTSVSKMAADYFESLEKKKEEDDYADLPMLREISGVLYGKGTPESAKKQYKDYLWEKYK